MTKNNEIVYLVIHARKNQTVEIQIHAETFLIDWGDLSFSWNDWPKSSPFIVGRHTYPVNGYYPVTITTQDLQEIDFSGCNCYGVAFENCRQIRKIVADNNRLLELPVTQCRKLTHLSCKGNRLKQLDIRGLSGLIHLDCAGNMLNNLLFGKNPRLSYLDCRGNRLKVLDISCYNSLAYLNCGDNLLGKESLEKIFASVHRNSIPSSIRLTGNPGESKCNMKKLEKKGWDINNEKMAA